MEAGFATSALLFTGLGLRASRNQDKLDQARIGYEQASGQTALLDAQLENTRRFRQSIASGIALAGARGGPGSSMLRQFSTESYANYLQDQAAINRKQQALTISGALSSVESRTSRQLRDLSMMAGVGMQLFQGLNLNKIAKSVPSVGGGS